MKNDHQIFLKHIMESIATIEEYTHGLSEEAWLKSPEKQDAIMRRLEIMGEAVKNLPEGFKAQHPHIAWDKAMATRNILIHHYFGIDLAIVWDTVTISLPEFKAQIKQLLTLDS
jgi:uncharacterized protein with HEPN domain